YALGRPIQIQAPEDKEGLAQHAVELYRDAISAIASNVSRAIQLFQQSIETYPLAPAYNNLGWLLLKSDAHGHGKHAAMVALERGAVVATEANDTATYADIQTNLGHVVRSRNPRSVASCLEAIAFFDVALQAVPLHVTALYNKASALFAIRQYHEAEVLLRRALEFEPSHTFAHLDLGLIYYARGNLELALKHHDLASANANSISQRANVMTNKANFLLKEGFAADSLAIFEEMRVLKPNGALELAHVAMAKRVLCLWDGVEDLHDRLVQSVEHELRTAAVEAGSSLYPFDSTLLRVSDAFRKRVATATAKRNDQPVTLELFPCALTLAAPTLLPTRPQKRLTIGYLSYDFRDHPMGQLILGFLENHNSDLVQRNCYSYGQDDESEWRARAMAACEVFRDIADVSDLGTAQQIAIDKVDIVIDLMVYTTGTRSEITALKPSPIVVNYLGYPGTSGASTINYVIADRFVVPPERVQSSMSEQVVYLPHTYQSNLYELENNEPCLDTAIYVGDGDADDKKRRFVPIMCPLAKRSDYGLPNAAIVFCNFNTINKYEPVAFFTWMRILHRVPGSVLWLLEPSSYNSETIMDTLYREALAHGVHPSRILFAAREDKSSHMTRLTLADIFLDSFVYNAHSTASDALWANVPIVTLWGDAFPSRVAASLIHNAIRFPEIVPHSVKEYEDLAITLAHNPVLLRRIRRELASQALASPLFDSRRTTFNLETSYEVMHDLTHRMFPHCQKDKRFHALVNPEASRDFDIEANTKLRLQRALERGIVHHQNGQLKQAEYYYLMVVQVNPKYTDALHLLGTLYFSRGDVDLAQSLLRRVVQESPDVVLYHLNAGLVYASLGNTQNAVTELQYVLRLEPSNVTAIKKLLEIFFNNLDFENVVQLFQSYDAILFATSAVHNSSNKDSEDHAVQEKAYLQYSYALLKTGRSVEAIEVIEGALVDHPQFFRAAYNLLSLYADQQMYPSADALLVRTVRAESHANFRSKGVRFPKLPRPRGQRVIALYCHEYGGSWWGAWGPSSLHNGLGGSEEAVVFLSVELRKIGYWVEVYGDPPHQDLTRHDNAGTVNTYRGVAWYPHYAYDPEDSSVDIFIAWRYHASLVTGQHARARYLWLHDIPSEVVLRSELLTSMIDGIFCVSRFHASLLPASVQHKVIVTSNALDPEYFVHGDGTNRANNFVYSSAPSRGLDTLLRNWPRIRTAIPNANLTIYYGFTTAFRNWGRANLPEFDTWMRELEQLIETLPSVHYVGLVGHRELAAGYANAGFYLYPTTFSETSSVSLMKAMAYGAIPITSRFQLSALPETCNAFDLGPRPLQSRTIDTLVLLAEDPEWIDLWIESIVDAVRNEDQTRAIRQQMKVFARSKYRWSRVAEHWRQIFTGRSP
uniref:protein O-GlcNAc transferase n=1 Tax=Globisporangium ultimum (strain ATCC 200006 / CBS 805.95 / DAOM BR144) TaxID=431595 RepID=K3WA70_GLOUD